MLLGTEKLHLQRLQCGAVGGTRFTDPFSLGLGWEGAHTPYMSDQGMVSAFQINDSGKPPTRWDT